MKNFLVVAGNIGVGKSTLTEKLAAKLGWKPFLEPHTENPYLADFYRDMRRWGFHSQIFFLEERLNPHVRLLNDDGDVIQDRSIYEDAEIFAHNLSLLGYIDERDYRVYQRLYAGIRATLQPPTLILYLRARVNTLQCRIQKRGREYEKNLSPAYLAQLNALYDQWASTFRACPVRTIDTDDRDFTRSLEDLDYIARLVVTELDTRAKL